MYLTVLAKRALREAPEEAMGIDVEEAMGTDGTNLLIVVS
jgi:hypothetical protein